jgi:hypothetical protein
MTEMPMMGGDESPQESYSHKDLDAEALIDFLIQNLGMDYQEAKTLVTHHKTKEMGEKARKKPPKNNGGNMPMMPMAKAMDFLKGRGDFRMRNVKKPQQVAARTPVDVSQMDYNELTPDEQLERRRNKVSSYESEWQRKNREEKERLAREMGEGQQ